MINKKWEEKYDHGNHGWHHNVVKNQKFFEKFKDKPVHLLEIGVFEGMSGCWFLENVLYHPESTYTGIDGYPWKDKYKDPFEFADVKAEKNLKQAGGDKVTLIKENSVDVIKNLDKKFDIIFIDGNHQTEYVIADSVMVWPLAKDLVIWDDRMMDGGIKFGVQRAIDYFLKMIPNQYKVIFDNEQFGIRKTVM